MKILVLSDLHHEFGVPVEIPEDIDYDVVVLAGDIDVRDRGGKWAVETFTNCPIIYVTGNHEYYGTTTTKTHRLLSELDSAHDNFHFLHANKPSVEIDGIVFIGSTLWTDFKLSDYHPNYDQISAMRFAKTCMNDYSRITTRSKGIYRRLEPADVLSWHQEDLENIGNHLYNAGLKKTVVITHHAPSPKSINEKYENCTDSNMYFASDLETFMSEHSPNIWIHGHMHDPVDYMIGSTRVFSNPRGYVMKEKYDRNSIYRENGESDQFRVIEL